MGYAIKTVGVVGGGTMGGGIAALVARSNRPVVVKEENSDLAKKAEKSIYSRFQKWFDLNKIDRNTFERLKSYVTVTRNIQDLVKTDLVIEAIPESMDLKKRLYIELDRIMPGHVILGSNTSSLPITEIGSVTNRPDKVAGMHFFNPPTTMPLVELIQGRDTSDDTIGIVEKFSRAILGKKTIRVIDRPGFLVNCLLLPYLGEAVIALEQNDFSIQEVDDIAGKLGFGWPMGPFALLDVIGLDTSFFVAEFLSKSYPEKVQLGTLFKALVDAGRLGEKVGVGFYDIKGGHESLPGFLGRIYGSRPHVSAWEIFNRMNARFLNEAVQAFQDSVATGNDIELGASLGVGFPKKVLHYIDEIGAGKLVQDLRSYEQVLGSRFTPAKLLVDMAERGETFYETE